MWPLSRIYPTTLATLVDLLFSQLDQLSRMPKRYYQGLNEIIRNM